MDTSKKSPNSPSFVKPLELFMMSKKKRLTTSPTTRFKVLSPLKCIDLNSPVKKQEASSARRLTPKKRKSPFKENNDLPRTKKVCKTALSKRRLIFAQDRNSVPLINLVDEDANLEPPKAGENRSAQTTTGGAQRLPVDWSLKIRMRFLSKKPFPFTGVFKASEDAAGTTSFVRCLSRQQAKNPIDSPTSESQMVDTSLAAKLRQHCFVWMCPHLPWLKVFPRPYTDKVPQLDLPPCATETLFNEWTYSLRSLYHLLKAKQAAFFYLCSDSFTVLFRASGVAGIDEINAFIYPTTSGFRKMLTEEQISFKLPFHSPIFNNECQNPMADNVQIDVSLKTEDKDDSMMFLESLGLSQQDFPTLKQSQPKLSATDCSKSSSLAVVTGPDTQLLITLLSNSRFSGKAASASNMPPTLLAPVAFHGGTLMPLKMKQTEFNHKNEAYFNLEINGPILPNCVNDVCQYLKETQEGDYKVHLVPHEYSSVFAAKDAIKQDSSILTVFATHNLQDCGLSQDFLEGLCSKTRQSKVPLKEIIVSHYLYRYTD